MPLPNIIEPHYLVLFHNPILNSKKETASGNKQNESGNSTIEAKDLHILQLEKELAQSREDMRGITEDQEAANEELQSANEELLSGSEELQSLNEEMETSKEELQSTNEVLTVVNQEMLGLNEQVTEARDYAEAIISTLNEPLLVLDKNLRIKSANTSFYKTFQVNEKDTVGKLLFDLGNKQWNIPDLQHRLQIILKDGENFENFEVAHNFPNIGERTVLLNAREIVNKLNGDGLILLAIADVTEQKLFEKELIEAKVIAENATKFKQQFLSNMSHEIRTPLNSILGFANVILKTQLDYKQKDFVHAIKTSGNSLNLLINDILDLAKVDAGKMIFCKTAI